MKKTIFNTILLIAVLYGQASSGQNRIKPIELANKRLTEFLTLNLWKVVSPEKLQIKINGTLKPKIKLYQIQNISKDKFLLLYSQLDLELYLERQILEKRQKSIGIILEKTLSFSKYPQVSLKIMPLNSPATKNNLDLFLSLFKLSNHVLFGVLGALLVLVLFLYYSLTYMTNVHGFAQIEHLRKRRSKGSQKRALKNLQRELHRQILRHGHFDFINYFTMMAEDKSKHKVLGCQLNLLGSVAKDSIMKSMDAKTCINLVESLCLFEKSKDDLQFSLDAGIQFIRYIKRSADKINPLSVTKLRHDVEPFSDQELLKLFASCPKEYRATLPHIIPPKKSVQVINLLKQSMPSELKQYIEAIADMRFTQPDRKVLEELQEKIIDIREQSVLDHENYLNYISENVDSDTQRVLLEKVEAINANWYRSI